nr:PREDICTED: uncharacterized protein LOC109634150 [Paralichthys olivaceus]
MHVQSCLCAAGVCVFSPSLCCSVSFCSICTSATDSLEPLQETSCKTSGTGSIMASKLSVLLLSLAVASVTVLAQRRRPSTSTNTGEWNYRDGSERVKMRGVANLTEVLDNWKFDIMNQMKGLLQNDHQSLLPDYARIQPLSEVLDDLYKEFNALKAHLGDLTEKFSAIETFIDEIKASRATNTNAGPASGPGPAAVPRQSTRRVMKKKITSSSASSS